MGVGMGLCIAHVLEKRKNNPLMSVVSQYHAEKK